MHRTYVHGGHLGESCSSLRYLDDTMSRECSVEGESRATCWYSYGLEQGENVKGEEDD